MRQCLFKAGLAACVAGSAALAQAQLHYDEAADGDLSLFSRLDLGLGANQVTGEARIGDVIDFDDFTFTVPAGGFLVSAVFTYFDVRPDDAAAVPNSFGTSFRLDSLTEGTLVPSYSFLVYSNWANPDPFPPSPVSLFSAALPLSDGTYQVRHAGNYLGIGNPGGRYAYTWTLTVSDTPAIPELPTGAYALLGLIAVGVRRLARRAGADRTPRPW